MSLFRRSILLVLLVLGLFMRANAQGSIEAQDTMNWVAVCDTAATDRGWLQCVCAQRDLADERLRRVYEDVLIVLNRSLANERSLTPIDSGAVQALDELHASVTLEQKRWLAYRDAAMDRAATMETTYGPRHGGSPCMTAVDLTLARVRDLSLSLFELQRR